MNKQEIIQNSANLEIPPNIPEDLKIAYQRAQYCKEYVHSKILERLNNDPSPPTEEEIIETFDHFIHETNRTIEILASNQIPEKEMQKNIFSFSNAKNLYKLNSIIKLINKNLADYLEKIVLSSPKVFSTEKEFQNLKIAGIDIILLHNNELSFIQLKTKKDTLTGSQKSRSRSELMIHEHAAFVALLELGKWTFNNDKTSIQRYAGETFWEMLEVPYDLITSQVIRSIRSIEAFLINAQREDN